MVARDYIKPIDAAIVENKPADHLPTLDDLRASKPSPACLTFTPEADALRTPFRDYVLQAIFELAQKELGGRLRDAVVSTWQSLDEPDHPILLPTFWADADDAERLRVDEAIAELVAEEWKSWSDEQKKDYGKMIYFGVEPIEV